MDIFTREANLRDLLEWAEMFPADLFLSVMEDAHILTSFYTETLIHQSEQLNAVLSNKTFRTTNNLPVNNETKIYEFLAVRAHCTDPLGQPR